MNVSMFVCDIAQDTRVIQHENESTNLRDVALNEICRTMWTYYELLHSMINKTYLLFTN